MCIDVCSTSNCPKKRTIDVTIFFVLIIVFYSSDSFKSDYQVVWMSCSRQMTMMLPIPFCCMKNTSADNRKNESFILFTTLEATIVASINILACFSFGCLFSLHCRTTTTLVSDPEASEQSYEIRFRGYLNATAVPIVSHAEFETYLFDH